MFRSLYRGFLIVLLTFVCGMIYLVSNEEFEHLNVDESVLASDEPAYSVQQNVCQIESEEDNNISDEDSQTTAVHMVIPSGEPIGIYVKTKGVMVIDIGEVTGSDNRSCSPCQGILESGDYILSVDGIEVEDKADLISIINDCEGEALSVEICRGDAVFTEEVVPVKSNEGSYMIGLWVKDDISGIGTLTYIDENGFGALGHSINDNDTGQVFNISDGAIYNANLVNIIKSNGSSPGRLEGMINYSSDNIVGRVESNGEFGICGYMTKKGTERMKNGEWMPVAKREEAHLGKAYLLSSVSGMSEYYEIEITGIDLSQSGGSKGIEIVITDGRLLSLTSGIVQGMSGTPIIQDGKLLGAVTHVFLKDSTKGYGAFVESMMEKND